MKSIITLFAGILLISGCNLLGSSGEERINARIELDKHQFDKGDTITATFINKSNVKIFRVLPSYSSTWLEKKIKNDWKQLHYHIDGVEFPPVVRFYEVDPGEVINISIPYQKLEKMVENTEGIYRLAQTISLTETWESDSKKVISDTFTIEE